MSKANLQRARMLKHGYQASFERLMLALDICISWSNEDPKNGPTHAPTKGNRKDAPSFRRGVAEALRSLQEFLKANSERFSERDINATAIFRPMYLHLVKRAGGKKGTEPQEFLRVLFAIADGELTRENLRCEQRP